ncbi:MAG: RNA ligase RtcB family protein [Clostridiales bacterium]|nr:RNA ligase RtcB family protein [Clostridiales bacterium]
MNTNNKLTIVSDDKNWMEGSAVNQAREVCNLDGVQAVFAMPDLHAGKTPVGVVVITKGKIYPHLIGSDIGCGMSIFSTGVESKRIKTDRWVSRLNTIKTLAAVPNSEYRFDCPIPDFGSIGSGNHFAEFQAIHEVFDAGGLAALAMDKSELFMTVHSGSRSYGSKILQEFNDRNGYAADGKEAKGYLEKHGDALFWAAKNRYESAKKLIDYLGFSQAVERKLECGHNFLERSGGLYYHRKGVVSAQTGAVLIAGSRGTLSYIVRPTAKCAEYGYSLAHGSGRKWARSMCKPRIREKYTLETIKRNKFGGQLVCHDYGLLFEEAPDAYKNVDVIIAVLERYGMIERVAALKPVLTFKG